ncbi:sensor histidine kinase [Solimonas flava]|uniref:sensor histidine kinase n=1 Tax=Solimonas flava TaxID=415849 RepID=UPI000A075838|nr:ATP-binding protein [Solimonas flava]
MPAEPAADVTPKADAAAVATPRAPSRAPAGPPGNSVPIELSLSWRSSTTRLIVIYGALFVVWSAVLIGVVHWETRNYLSTVVDQILEQRAHYFATIERERLPEAMKAASAIDLQGVMAYGLFTPDGRYLSGNLRRPPQGLPADGRVRLLARGIERRDRDGEFPARTLALYLPSGELMVLARGTNVIEQVGLILRQSLLWALSLTLIPGLIGGYLLSRGPLRRVRAIEAAVQPIMQGQLDARLPVSRRRDELDLLATIVNTMLAELEHLMGEVKGVCDNIAHDLRTPLTRLRAQLHRLRTQTAPADARAATIDRCIDDVDALLARFAALLRISEMEDLRRRAGFGHVDLAATVRELQDLYAPLAEDKDVQLQIEIEEALPAIPADRELLFEAISNLLSNAVKFTPPGGAIRMRLRPYDGGAKLCVVDSGPGIPPGEREAVLQRFYRSDCTRHLPGSGLGLSIVSAIMRLHGFRLEIGESEHGGARVSLYCVPRDLSGAA